MVMVVKLSRMSGLQCRRPLSAWLCAAASDHSDSIAAQQHDQLMRTKSSQVCLSHLGCQAAH
ncbi:hypothetical protein HaLaN_02677 [Haematococcus lacustris]|uniref:Uncharacterized protein n=1 Tax=Haematococcus lacustris TaxID=44745 RepID=A0A699YCF2_HAELA|nr:hypothetical protein HaLaN_02677 [Haematococcus lacustris]